ncbi:MAG TPA: hypothetical protein VIV60_09245 [Polyangiaceae bacterium]
MSKTCERPTHLFSRFQLQSRDTGLWAGCVAGALALACSESAPSGTDHVGVGGGVTSGGSTVTHTGSGTDTGRGGQTGTGGTTAGVSTTGAAVLGGASSNGGTRNFESSIAVGGKTVDTNAAGGKATGGIA